MAMGDDRDDSAHESASETRVQAPAPIADLMGQVLDLELRAIAASAHDCPIQIVLGQRPAEPHEGLFVDVSRERAVHHQGMVWTTYRNGRPELGHAWDQEGDIIGKPVPYADWLRNQVSAMVGDHLLRAAWSVWETIAEGRGARELDALLARSEAITTAALRFRGTKPRSVDTISALRALLRIAKGGSRQPAERVTLSSAAVGVGGHIVEPKSPLGALAREGLKLVGRDVQREVAAALEARVKDEARSIVEGRVKGMSAHRFGEYRRAFEACVPAVWNVCFTVFDEAGRDPALAQRQSEEQRTVQAWINEYNDLSREFAASSPLEDEGVEERALRLVSVEGRLNRYWQTVHAQRLDRCVEDGRFLSSGSAGYVGWLRKHERYEEAIRYVCTNMADVALSHLRHRTHPLAFETYVSNGLGSFLDSSDTEHIECAVELLDDLASVITFRTGDALYQCACVHARAGRVDSALDLVERAVAAGESIRAMAHDSDLAAIVDHPRFRAMRDAS